MAAIPLNRVKTITHPLTTSAVGIYTCPPGVSALIIYGNVSNVGGGSSVRNFTVQHKRNNVETTIVSSIGVPASDAMSFIEGRLVLETGDILTIFADANDTMEGIISVLENAK